MLDKPKVFPLGDNAITINFGNEISVSTNERVIALAESFSRDPFPGFIEAVPAYSSLVIFYDLGKVRQSFPASPTAHAAVSDLVESALLKPIEPVRKNPRIVEIPTDFSDAAALDIETIALQSGLSSNDVIDLFVARAYRVFMIGFLPGFAYMGDVDKRIALPRKDSPRKRVPKGSVGIAGRQTGIYPLDSPGGWQIIGRTSIDLFMPHADAPCLLKPGDTVRFVPAE